MLVESCLQFVKNTVSVKLSKVRYHKMRYTSTLNTTVSEPFEFTVRVLISKAKIFLTGDKPAPNSDLLVAAITL